MRLIDADEVIKELNDKIVRLDAKQQIYMNNGLTSIADSMARKIELYIECKELLEHQPTAYDVDKVIEEWTARINVINDKSGKTGQVDVIGSNKAIKIVEGGGVSGDN